MVAAAVMLGDDFDVCGLEDSKKLTPLQRERQRMRIIRSSCLWGIGIAGHDIVDEINVLQASFLAMRRAIDAIDKSPSLILVDGNRKIPGLSIAQRTIVDGDALEPCISAASIMAKTFRDDLMREYAGQYPEYGFERHKGYPTERHLASLMRYGPCPIHRKSFHPVSTFFQGLSHFNQ